MNLNSYSLYVQTISCQVHHKVRTCQSTSSGAGFDPPSSFTHLIDDISIVQQTSPNMNHYSIDYSVRCFKHEEMNPFLKAGNIKPTYFPPYMEMETQNSNGIGREKESTQNNFCIWYYFKDKILPYFQLIEIKSFMCIMLDSRQSSFKYTLFH